MLLERYFSVFVSIFIIFTGKDFINDILFFVSVVCVLPKKKLFFPNRNLAAIFIFSLNSSEYIRFFEALLISCLVSSDCLVPKREPAIFDILYSGFNISM